MPNCLLLRRRKDHTNVELMLQKAACMSSKKAFDHAYRVGFGNKKQYFTITISFHFLTKQFLHVGKFKALSFVFMKTVFLRIKLSDNIVLILTSRNLLLH